MTAPPKKRAIVIPDADQEPDKGQTPFVLEPDDGGRDVTKPIGYDARGLPLYAPRGPLIQLWRPPS